MAQGGKYRPCLLIEWGGFAISSSNLETEPLYTRVRLVLVFSTTLSFIFIVVGLLLAARTSRGIKGEVISLSYLFPQIVRLESQAILSLGILILLLTPFLYMVPAVVIYLRKRDRLFAGISAAVLFILLTNWLWLFFKS